MADKVKIMVFYKQGPPQEVTTTEQELYRLVMIGALRRNAFLDYAGDNPKRLPAFEDTTR